MPAMSFTEILGFMGKVIAALENMRDELAKAGIDADTIIAMLSGLRDRISELNEKQESLKRETRATTLALEATTKEGYARASGALDTIIAAVDKTSHAAKNLREMRAEILRSRRGRKRAETKES